MLPTNVMSFMKKMVNTEPGSTLSATGTGSAASDAGSDSGGMTFGKLKQTLSSGLLTAQDKVVKMSPRPSLIPVDIDPPSSHPIDTSTPAATTTTTTANSSATAAGKPPSRTGACRVCLKAFKPDDFSRTCAECHQRVCEDCASYSKVETADGGEGENGAGECSWTCSVCRRKLQSRAAMQQDSSESLLDVPMQQELQRRHSEARLGTAGGLTPGGLSSGLAPPRSPELRRHSDVSPASLKELEKLKGTPGGPSTCGPGGSEFGRRGNGHSCASSRANSPPRGVSGGGGGGGLMMDAHPRSRRGSRVVARQHSYDDDVKSGSTGDMTHIGSSTASSGGLMSLPAPMPRRASAYDVFTVPALSTVTTSSLPQAPSSGMPTSRRPSFRGVPCQGPGGGGAAAIAAAAAATAANQQNADTPTTPPSPDLVVLGGGLMVGVDDEVGRRQRRRGSQLPDIAGLRQGQPLLPTDQPMARPQPALEDLEAAPPRRQASVDAEAIRIVIHDVDSAPGGPGGGAAAQRRVVLRRDPSDKIHRTRGFGMRVVGGKTAPDGRLFAYIVWTVPGGPAERGGLQQGDKVLEWSGVSLIDRSFEEVCAIMDRTGDVVELMVEHATDLRMCDFLDDPTPPQPPSSSSSPGVIVGSGQMSSGGGPASGVSLPTLMGVGPRKTSDGGLNALHVDPDTENKTPSSPTRRKLPKTPEQIARERTVSGRVQLQVWYHDERRELVVAVLAADDLAPRDDSLGFGNLPEAYARICLLPLTSEKHCTQTEVAPGSQNPIWNANLSFPGVPGDELMERILDVSLWDLIPHSEHAFLGECSVDLQKAFLDDRALWVRLEDPRQLRAGRSPHTSPRGSIVGGSGRRGDFGSQRSQSDDIDSIGDCASLLHPDHAWGPSSRRGSSQSEQLEVEVYQLGKDFSRSLPGSRRSSFQSGQEPEPIAEVPGENQVTNILNAPSSVPSSAQPSAVAPMSYNRDRRRSSCTRMLRDPEEILRSLKAVKGELGRTMSLTGDKYRQHRRSSAASNKRDNITTDQSPIAHQLTTSTATFHPSTAPPSIIANTQPHHTSTVPAMRSNNVRADSTPPSSPERTSPPRLGPGQIKPRGFQLASTRPVELKLGLQMSKGQLELEVVQGRHINPTSDTYVKCYLRDGERWLQKRKTRVVRHAAEPHFRQTLRYQACDVFGRSLVIMLWERQGGFEHNTGLGGCEIGLDSLTLTQLTTGWYPLFPIHSLGSDSNDSP